jgi:uncharacterized protein (UPF0264 family)
MTKLNLLNDVPGLLVSVRSATEALAALAGGADVIDVKEPNHGSLGAADDDTIAAVVKAVGGRVPVSAALGELVDLPVSSNGNGMSALVTGVSLFKLGLAGCTAITDWQAGWQHALDKMLNSSNCDAKAVAVVYADWRAAQAPSPQDVLSAAIERRCPALLIDTWNKSGGTLFDHWPPGELKVFVAEVRSHNISIVLAGSLHGQSVITAARLAPDLVAVRTAACDGGRAGTVSEKRVRELKKTIATATRTTALKKSSKLLRRN